MGHSEDLVARTTLRIAGVFQEITEAWSKRLDSYFTQLDSLIKGEWLGPNDIRGMVDAAIGSALLATISPLSAIALLVFVLLYTPCIGTIGAVWKETGSIKWTALSIGYQLVLAYLAAFTVVLIGGVLFI